MLNDFYDGIVSKQNLLTQWLKILIMQRLVKKVFFLAISHVLMLNTFIYKILSFKFV